MKNLKIVDPLGYVDNLSLMDKAQVVLTDSGGIQEETTVLSTPCLTLRKNTERPITSTQGTNRLVGLETETIRQGFRNSGTQMRVGTTKSSRSSMNCIPRSKLSLPHGIALSSDDRFLAFRNSGFKGNVDNLLSPEAPVILFGKPFVFI